MLISWVSDIYTESFWGFDYEYADNEHILSDLIKTFGSFFYS